MSCRLRIFSRRLALMCVALAVVACPVLADVQISGLDEAQEVNVRAYLRLAALDCDEPNWLISWEFREAKAQIAEGLEALGYYTPKIEGALRFEEDCWRAEFEVEPGEPVVVRAVHLEIAEPLASMGPMQKAMDTARALVDQPLNHQHYESAKNALVDVASNFGFFDAELLEARVEVHAAEGWAEVVLTMSSGPRYEFGPVSFGEHPPVKTKLLVAMVPFSEGDPFDNELLVRFRRTLAGTNFFSRSLVVAEKHEADGLRVPIRVDLAPPLRRWTYLLGAGYATDTKLRLRAQANNPLRNRRGHRIESHLQLSKVLSAIDLSYQVPHRNPRDDWLSFDTSASRERTSTSDSDILRVGARHTYNRGIFIQTDFVDYRLEDWAVGSTQDDRTKLVLFGTHLLRVKSEAALVPRRGYRVGITLRGAHDELFSDTSFAQVITRARFVTGLTEKTRALVRGEFGATFKDDFDELPASMRFFAGGDNSIRGYGFKKVGPEEDGEVVGGSNVLTGSVELDYLFRPRWAVAAFVDTGSAYDETPSWFTGVGAGIRWHSPLGAVRVDLAHPLDDDTRNWRVHVSLGPDL